MKSKNFIIVFLATLLLFTLPFSIKYFLHPPATEKNVVVEEEIFKPEIPDRPTVIKKEVATQKIEFKSKFFLEHIADIQLPFSFTNGSSPVRLRRPRPMTLEISTAIYMLGYSFDKLSDPEIHLKLLKKFQRENGFPASTILSANVLIEMDSQLFEFEKVFEGYSQKFSPLFDRMVKDVPGSLFPEDYVAWIFIYPLEVLPSYLQMTSVDEILNCIDVQCTGSILDEKGEVTHYGSFEILQIATGRKTVMKTDIKSLGNFQFKSDFFAPEIPKPSTSQVHVILHEYAHYLGTWGGKPMNDPNRPHFRMIDTTEFYNITADYRDGKAIPGNGVACYPLKTGIEGFLTYYSYDNRPSEEGECPPNSSASRLEDFADSFSFYVTAGKHFRKAAEQNDFIRRKYNWLKTKVFNGVEYDTELTHFNQLYTGCTDKDFPSATPGYISCDTDFVWNRELKIK